MATVVVRTATFRDTEQNMRILSILNEQRASSRFCDVLLRVFDQQIFAHSNVLAAASPYFASFLGLGQDSPRAFSQNSPQIIEIHIENVEGDTGYSEAVRRVVEFMYTYSIELNMLIITQVIQIAKIMQIHRIIDYCDRFQKGENGNLPLNKGTGMPLNFPELSLSRRFLRKVNAATETEEFLFQKCASNTDGHTNKIQSNNVVTDRVDENGSSDIALLSENLILKSVNTNNVSSFLQLTDTSTPLNAVLPDTPSQADDEKDEAEKMIESPLVSVPIVDTNDDHMAIKQENDTLDAIAHSAEQMEPTPTVEVPEIKEENPPAAVLCSNVIPVPFIIATPVEEKSRPVTARGRRKGRRRRKRKPREALSDSDPDLLQDPDIIGDDIPENNSFADSGMAADKDGKLTTSLMSSEDMLRSFSATDVVLSASDSSMDTGRIKNDIDLPPSRTRGKKPITSVMATWASPRRRAGIPRSLYKTDYVIHSIIRRSRHAGEAVSFSSRSDGNNENAFEDITKTGDSRHFSSPGLKFVCQTCDFTAASFLIYKQHMKRHPETDTRSYTCTECSFHTTKARQLLQHRKKHLHEELICSYCEIQFDTEENFQTHLHQHSHPLPYFCESCELRFKTRNQLATHLPRHMTEKPFGCQVCGSRFKWKHALKNHMVTHSSTKDHLCDICGFATAHKSQLKAHRLIHTGDTFKCQEPGCTFQATKRQNLKYHMVTHTQEKSHQCEVCGQAFSLIKNLRRHMLLHGDSRPYPCSLCTYTTTRYDKLKEHKLKHHGIGQPPSKKMKFGHFSEVEGITIGTEDVAVMQADCENFHMIEPITIAREGNNFTIRSEVTLTEEALQTIAQLAASSSGNTADGSHEAQINISTSEGYPIIARVQFASDMAVVTEEDIPGYVEQQID